MKGVAKESFQIKRLKDVCGENEKDKLFLKSYST